MKIVLVASGKGGTGKTAFTSGVSVALAKADKRVLVIDGDCGLRNIDIALGMSDCIVYSFADVAGGVVPLADAVAVHPRFPNLCLLTAPAFLPAISERGMEQLAAQAEEIGFDYILIDGPAGIPAELSWFACIATQAIIVTTPDSACIRGAERCARTLEEENYIARIRIVINRVRPDFIRKGQANNIDDAMDETGLSLLGLIPEDKDLIAAGNKGKSIHEVKKKGAACAFQNIARRIEGERVPLMKI